MLSPLCDALFVLDALGVVLVVAGEVCELVDVEVVDALEALVVVVASLLPEYSALAEDIEPMPVVRIREGIGVFSCLTRTSACGDGASTTKSDGSWQLR